MIEIFIFLTKVYILYVLGLGFSISPIWDLFLRRTRY